VTDRVTAVDRTTFNRNSGAVAQAVGEVAIRVPQLGELCVLLLDENPDKRPSASEALWTLLKGTTAAAEGLTLQPQYDPVLQQNAISLSKSNDVATLVSGLLRDDDILGMEAAVGRLNEILVQEPSKRASMGEIYATPAGRMSGLSAICSCLSKGSPLAQHRAAAAMRNALLDERNDVKVIEADVAVLCAAVVMGTPPTQANAAAALGNVCCTSGAGRTYVLTTSGKLAQSAILEAATAVRNACINHNGNRNEVMKARGVLAFVHVLQDRGNVPSSLRERHVTMLENVVGALRNACNQHNGNCMQLAEGEGISVAVLMLANSPQSVLDQAVGLIRNACIGYFGNKDHINRCGGFWNLDIVAAIRYATIGHDGNLFP
ncbi:hypothetical protein T484DRAFT_1791885, partial [Baffinella frigidus]